MEQCLSCGSALVVWPYYAADGDLFFAGAFEVLEGSGEVQKRAALICPKCDTIDRFPRRRAVA